MKKKYAKKLGMCVCGNKGIKVVDNQSICERCAKLESQAASFVKPRYERPLTKYIQAYQFYHKAINQ